MRKTIGATNPADADPGTIRGDFATSMPNNLIHGSDSPESARARDLALVRRTMSSSELPEYAVRNRARWTKSNAEYTGTTTRPSLGRPRRSRGGLWGVPEAELNALPDVAGKDVVELGCGTAYFSAWLARRGARPVGVDVTPAQLETARRAAAGDGLEFPLLEANAERRAAAGCIVRRRALRVRRLDLVRSLPLDPGGGAAAPAGRRARLPAQLDARRCSARALDGWQRDAAAAAARAEPARLGGRRDDRVPPRPRRAVRAPARDRLRRPRPRSSCTRRRRQRRPSTTTPITPSGAKRWPWEEIWRARKR